MVIDFQDQYVKRILMELGLSEEDLKGSNTDEVNKDTVKTLKEILARKKKLEEEFYSSNRAREDVDNYIYFAFLLECIQNIIDTLDEEGGDELYTTLKYLNDCKFKLLYIAIKELFIENVRRNCRKMYEIN